MKKQIRKEYLEKRNNILNREERSSIICSLIQKHPSFQTSQIVGIYKSFMSEVDTKDIIASSYMCGKIVCFPRVEGDDLVFYKTEKDDLFEKSSYGIEEPFKKIQNRIEPDLVIVPGVVFDENGGRMGYGKGYYDRYFEKHFPNKVGICFREQLIDKVPMNSQDIFMDSIIHD